MAGTRPYTRVIIVLGSVFLVGIGVVGCVSTRTPNLYLMRDGYVGWVIIKYDRPHAAPLKVVGGYRILNAATGVIETCNSLQGGRAKDMYCYQRGKRRVELRWEPDAPNQMIWQPTTGFKEWPKPDGSGTQRGTMVESFYVGTRAQFYKAAGWE